MRHTSLSLVLPAFNEADNLAVVVRQSLHALDRAGLGDFEVIVVDDGSTDGSAQVASELARKHPRIRVISHDDNLGLGAAVKTGFSAARMEYACRMDADGQMDPEDVVTLLRAGAGADMIVSAYTTRPESRARLLLSWSHRRLLGLLLGLPYAHQGAYLIRTDVFRRLCLHLNTGFVGYEMLAKVYRAGGTIFQGHMAGHPRLYGASKVLNGPTLWRSMREVLRLRHDVGRAAERRSWRGSA